ncbi:single-stranded DNA-binding protein [Chitinispirillum alkaliphilum]|nr:single-stranded DNA-binding protein [Chitinispirillum alkaliphilum]
MKTIARNKKAFHDYDILEKVEAGIVLSGSEVKSIRQGKINLLDSYAQCSRGELYIIHLHISPYGQSGMYTPDPYRRRKLLLHKKQIEHLCSEVERKQLTLIPLSVYFKDQYVKLQLGLCRGRKKYDKRQKIAEQESKRRISQLVKRSRT